MGADKVFYPKPGVMSFKTWSMLFGAVWLHIGLSAAFDIWNADE